MSDIFWPDARQLSSTKYVCGHCNALVASDQGWLTYDREIQETGYERIRLCPHCGKPTFFEPPDLQIPGVPYGKAVSSVPDKTVAGLYEEARRATAASAHTAAGLCCRKILMHVAVQKGAPEAHTFAHYIEFLVAGNHIPKDSKEWVDWIRSKSNEANHEITLISASEAEVMISFVEMLLKIVYEFPAEARKRVKP